MVILLIVLIFISNCYAQDTCSDLVLKVVKPIPAMVNGKYLDAREKHELAMKYNEALTKVAKLVGDYIQIRKELDEKGAYYHWQWKRVEEGIEYKREVWRDYIKDYSVLRAHLRNIERQLTSLGISQQELDLCYKQSK